MASTLEDEVAAILFTSGSTGIPKGAVYRHGNFMAQVEMIRATYGIKPGEIDLPTFPLFALFDPALGMTTIIPDMDAANPAKVDPAKLHEAIENFGVTNMFGSPAVLRRLVDYGKPLPRTLNRVLSAGASVRPVILDGMRKLLPEGVQVFTPYGATESLPVASIGSAELLGETRALTDQGAGICVGRPADGVKVDIIEITDTPIATWSEVKVLPAGQVGEIVARSPTVTSGYFNREQQTALAKIRGPNGETAHRMGDVGYFDERGRLWFCGRKSHRVVTPKGTLFTEQVEGVFNANQWGLRTALVGVKRNGVMEPALCIELGTASRDEALKELKAIGGKHALTQGIQLLLPHGKPFPVDIRHNAKIFREKLAVWAAEQLK
jgi:acyl-CoA synthetase (AMP-forming)/AMP-acid ligase II